MVEDEVVPSLKDLIKCVRVDALTSSCTPEILNRQRIVGALEIRKLLLQYGKEEGWRRAKELFKSAQCLTRLNRELTDDEIRILQETLGHEFDRSGYLTGSCGDSNIFGTNGGGRRRLPER